MRTVTIDLDSLNIVEEAPEFRDLDRATLRDIDTFISTGGVDVDDDEVADLDAILAAHEDNPFG